MFLLWVGARNHSHPKCFSNFNISSTVSTGISITNMLGIARCRFNEPNKLWDGVSMCGPVLGFGNFSNQRNVPFWDTSTACLADKLGLKFPTCTFPGLDAGLYRHPINFIFRRDIRSGSLTMVRAGATPARRSTSLATHTLGQQRPLTSGDAIPS